MDLDQIEKLNDLKQRGLITEEEYQLAKERILNARAGQSATQDSVQGPAQGSAPSSTDLQPYNADENRNYDYAMILHITQAFAWLFPLLGVLVPLIMWQSKKDDPYVDQQGRVVMNWVFSAWIYGIIAGLLSFVLIGIPLLILLCICSVIFMIIGAVDANKGIVKSYPGSIKFFKVQETPRA